MADVGKSVKKFFKSALASFREARKEARARGEKDPSHKEMRNQIKAYRTRIAGEAAFAQMFGASFDELFIAAAVRHLRRLLPDALPQVLWQLSQVDPAVATSDKPFVACLHKVGAYWGDAPEGGDVSTDAFHATFAPSDQEGKYDISYRGGTASIFGGLQVTIAPGTKTGIGTDLYCFLLYDPTAQHIWNIGWDTTSFPNASAGQYVVRLWHFTYPTENFPATITQNHDGDVVLPRIRNAVDSYGI